MHTTMKRKKERLNAIKKLIMEARITSQDDLMRPLVESGFELTQATLSRDLKELKIAKVPDSEGRYVYVLPKEDSIANTVQYPLDDAPRQTGLGGFLSIRFSRNIAVIKTTPGFAGSIAYDIDYGRAPEILGTLAGDDTIMVVLQEDLPHKKAYEILSRYIPALRPY